MSATWAWNNHLACRQGTPVDVLSFSSLKGRAGCRGVIVRYGTIHTMPCCAMPVASPVLVDVGSGKPSYLLVLPLPCPCLQDESIRGLVYTVTHNKVRKVPMMATHPRPFADKHVLRKCLHVQHVISVYWRAEEGARWRH